MMALDEGDADNALGDRPDRRHREMAELGTVLAADDTGEDGPATAIAGLAQGHDDAGDDDGSDELQNRSAGAGDQRQRRLGQLADLRLQALHQPWQIGIRLLPEDLDPLADDGLCGHGGARRRDVQRAQLHVPDQLVHRIAHRTQQQRRGDDDQHDAEHGD